MPQYRRAIDSCLAYDVEAEPIHGGDGFVGAFCIPGLTRRLVRNPDGTTASFDTEDEAIAAAGEGLCDLMNSRTISTDNSYGYRVIGGAELAVALARLELSPAVFAMFCGTDHRRVMEWIDGKQSIPRTVNLIVTLLALPGAIKAAHDLTDSIIYKKKADTRPFSVETARRAS